MEQPSRAAVTPEPAIYLALELGDGKWKIAFTTGVGRAPRERTIKAGDLTRLQSEIRHAKERFGLPSAACLTSCYEAGRSGFWLHRYLCQQGIDNHVVDSSSIHVQRRARQAKTDRLDVHRLLQLLLRFAAGEREVWSIVHVPNRGAEDLRQFHRELVTLKRDRTRVTNRIKGLLASQGVVLDVTGDLETRLESVRLWDGSPLSTRFLGRLQREAEKWHWLTRQIAEVEAEQRRELQNSNDKSVEMIRRLMRLRGIGASSAWLFVTEFFAWRHFRNRREVGALAGLAPTPHQSGARRRELGISKSGNRL